MSREWRLFLGRAFMNSTNTAMTAHMLLKIIIMFFWFSIKNSSIPVTAYVNIHSKLSTSVDVFSINKNKTNLYQIMIKISFFSITEGGVL